MADRELNAVNAYEGEITPNAVGPSDLTFNVDTTVDSFGNNVVAGDGAVLCVNPDKPTLREYVLFTGSTATTFTVSSLSDRYLDGSAESPSSPGITHPAGSKVRSVSAEQMFQDLHDRIEAHAHTGGTAGTTLGTSALNAGILAASAAGRALMATDFFDSATVADKFATDSFDVTNVADLLANDSIVNALIATGAVDTDELAADAVETAKILDGAVTTAKTDFFQIVRKTANEDVTSSTTLQDDDELLLPVGSSEIWVFQAFIRTTAQSATPDIKFTFSAPTNGSGAFVQSSSTGTSNETDFGTTEAVALDTGNRTFFIAGMVLAGDGGNLTFRWAQNTSSADFTRVRQNSWMKAWLLP